MELFSRQYYFVAAALPTLSLEEKPELSVQQLLDFYQRNLSTKDWHWVTQLCLQFDLNNLRALWRQEAFSSGGTLLPSELEEALLLRQGLPPFVFEFLDRYPTNEERLRHFSTLISQQFRLWEEEGGAPALLRGYLKLEHGLRLVLLALRARDIGRELAAELADEDPTDPLVLLLMAQKESPITVVESPYEAIPALYAALKKEPLLLQKALLRWRSEQIDELLGMELFSLNCLLGYYLQLLQIEKWHRMDAEKGIQIINQAVEGRR